MNIFTRVFNVPVADKLFDIEFEHNQTKNKMIVKVEGNTQTTRYRQKTTNIFWFGDHVKLEVIVTKHGPLRHEDELKVDDQVVPQLDGRIGK